MNLYISDIHFGHKNVIGFDHRPFVDLEEMDHCLIKLWNGRVSPEDHVYIVGDFAYRNEKGAEWYNSRHGSWHIYGHIHGNKGETYEFMKNRENALNAAACINHYTPASLNELIRNNELFQKRG